MPIYEYESTETTSGCEACRDHFEVIQSIDEKPLTTCTICGTNVKRIISWCRAVISSDYQLNRQVTNKIAEYEKSGMWSHAAELADKHAEKTNTKELRTRALDNYKKAGYNTISLEKHAKDLKK